MAPDTCDCSGTSFAGDQCQIRELFRSFSGGLCSIETLVELDFEKPMYSVIESVDSEDLALYVCLRADSVDRPFSVTLSPLSGTATGI